MALRSAVAAVLQQRSDFRFADTTGDLRSVSSRSFAAHAGTLVLWPMANDARAVRRLFEALEAGVVPILLPKTTAPSKLRQLRERYARFGFFDGEAIEPAPEPLKPAQEVFLALLTSGSTGEPKMLVVNEDRLTAGIRAIHAAQDLEDVASAAVWLPLAYSYALVNQLLWAVLFQRQMIGLPGLLDVPASFEAMREHRSGMLCMVAHQIQSLAARDVRPKPMAYVEVLNFAGAPFPVATFDFLRALFPSARIYNNYGCTEAMPRLTVCRVHDATHPVTLVGAPIETVRLRIDGDAEVGPIVFQGASASCGLLREDGGIDAHPEWIPSGDLGRLETKDQKDVLHVLGRHDQIVKVGGERFSLIEIEQAILSLGFTQALIWQEPSDSRVRAVVAGGSVPSTAELTRGLRQLLPTLMWPARIDWTEQWPLLPSGKTDRAALQEAARTDKLKAIFRGRES